MTDVSMLHAVRPDTTDPVADVKILQDDLPVDIRQSEGKSWLISEPGAEFTLSAKRTDRSDNALRLFMSVEFNGQVNGVHELTKEWCLILNIDALKKTCFKSSSLRKTVTNAGVGGSGEAAKPPPSAIELSFFHATYRPSEAAKVTNSLASNDAKVNATTMNDKAGKNKKQKAGGDLGIVAGSVVDDPVPVSSGTFSNREDLANLSIDIISEYHATLKKILTEEESSGAKAHPILKKRVHEVDADEEAKVAQKAKTDGGAAAAASGAAAGGEAGSSAQHAIEIEDDD